MDMPLDQRAHGLGRAFVAMRKLRLKQRQGTIAGRIIYSSYFSVRFILSSNYCAFMLHCSGSTPKSISQSPLTNFRTDPIT